MIITFHAPSIQQTVWLMIVAILFTEACALAETSGEVTLETQITVHVSGRWKRIDSPNFRCWCQLPEDEAKQVAVSCEALRERLRTTWISEFTRESWVPKCEVVVYPDEAQYNCALNKSGEQSVGSTRMKFDQHRTVFRRIDLRADSGGWLLAALPHELTHVVMGERFGCRCLPPWADEGIAMFSESSEKHQERLLNLQKLIGKQLLFTLPELIQIQRVQDIHCRDAFYGQSLALSSLLIRKSTPAGFANFVDDVRQNGFDEALQKHYRLKGISALQREWTIGRPDRQICGFSDFRPRSALKRQLSQLGNRGRLPVV